MARVGFLVNLVFAILIPVVVLTLAEWVFGITRGR
jgi:hypothetical protein